MQTSQVLTAETPRRREIPKKFGSAVSAPSAFSVVWIFGYLQECKILRAQRKRRAQRLFSLNAQRLGVSAVHTCGGLRRSLVSVESDTPGPWRPRFLLFAGRVL